MTPPTQPPLPSPEQEKRTPDYLPRTEKAAGKLAMDVSGVPLVTAEFANLLETQLADFAKEGAEHEREISRNRKERDELSAQWKTFLARAMKAESDLLSARTALAAIRSATTLHEEGDEETSIPEYIHSLRTAITATNRNLLNATNLLAQKEDTIRSLEEKGRNEKKIAHDARHMEADKTNDLLLAEQRITSLEEEGREAEKDRDTYLENAKHWRSKNDEACLSLSKLLSDHVALAAALKQAREALVNLRGWAVANTTKPIHDLLVVTDAALSPHPDSALLGRISEGLKAGLACAKACTLNTTYHERVINEALADIGGQQP